MKVKRPIIAFFLGFFFGPLAFFYAGWRAGVASLLAFVPAVLVQLCLVWADFTLELPVLEIERLWGLALVIFGQLCFGLLCAVFIPNDDPRKPIDDRLAEMGFLWGLIGWIGWWSNDLMLVLAGVFQSPHDWKLLWFFLLPHAWIDVIAYTITMTLVWLSVRKITFWWRCFKTAPLRPSPQIIKASTPADNKRIVKCSGCGALNRTPRYSLKQRAICGNCKTPLPEVFYKSSFRFLCNPRPFLRKHYAWVIVVVIVGLAVLIMQSGGFDSSPSDYTPVASSSPPNSPPIRPVQPAFTEPELALPESGQIVQYNLATAEAPFEIKSDYGSHYLLKLVNAYTKAPVLKVFVRGGSTVNIEVPIGTYEIRYAAGNHWYGDAYLFGPETAYSKADKTFDFRYEGNQVSGYTITLYKVQGGNLRTSRIKPTEF